jgi:TniB protein
VRILHGLGAPYSAYWRIDALERAAMNALALVHVQMLIVEEFQQLIAGSAREQRISLNLIKSIANDLRISVVGVGTDEARYAIEADKQIRRRFDPFSLPRWTETEDFRDFVSAFGKIFPLRKASSLGERGLVQRLLQASEGITGPVTRLLSLAAVEAIRSSSECIDEAGIDLAATRLEQDFT